MRRASFTCLNIRACCDTSLHLPSSNGNVTAAYLLRCQTHPPRSCCCCPSLPCVATRPTSNLSYPSFRIQDPEAKIKARQELVAGALGDKLKLLTKLVVCDWLLYSVV
jgi:hypothetical protein